MLHFKKTALSFLLLCNFVTLAFGHYDPKSEGPEPRRPVSFREACTTPRQQIDQDVNNVRARLTTGGDIWWDRNVPKYVVPKVPPGEPEVSAISVGGLWLGGLDPGGNLKTACQTYGNRTDRSDYWPGPLTADEGVTTKYFCDNWDRFFTVTRQEIEEHLRHFRAARSEGVPYTADMIPAGVKGWPAKGNPYFSSIFRFHLPFNDQGLAGFWDEDLDGRYDPLKGDFPSLDIRCPEDYLQSPDQMIFWIFNDEGGGAVHGETHGNAMRMEVQALSFAYATNDAVNNMTFQRYKLINRAKEDLDSTYFGLWVDFALGCPDDDFIGCDTSRNMAYCYNSDAMDGTAGIFCPMGTTGIPTYGTDIPVVGVDFFRGPLNEFREELSMSSFIYISRTSANPPQLPGMSHPTTGMEFYRYLTGSWRDGTPLTVGGNGYNPGSTNFTKYAFPSPPNDVDGWSLCTTLLPPHDHQTVQSSGPFKLQPGAVNEMILGVIWVPSMDYPCPDITRLQQASDLAQDLFDCCFCVVDGPDAPDIDFIELDRELIAIFTNAPTSNNYLGNFEETGIGFPANVDSTYKFEGYLLYQLAGPEVSQADYNDPSKARLVHQTDKRNGIGTLYNWVSTPNPDKETDPTKPPFIFYPEVKIEGLDQGIRHTFRITEDQFALGDRRLVNHRKYYFSAVAYAHNNYEQFDPVKLTGQKTTYLEGRRNVKVYSVIPRPIVDRHLLANYADGVVLTRLDGIGSGDNFLDISDETRRKILDGSFNGEIEYKEGRGPISVRIYNPLDVVDGDFEITFVDENMANAMLDQQVFWQMRDLGSTGPPMLSETTIESLNEQILGQYGFSIAIGQRAGVGAWADPTDGAIGYELAYADPGKPAWFRGIPDGFSVPNNLLTPFVFDFVRYKEKWIERRHEVLANIGPGYFVPFMVCDGEPRPLGNEAFYISPAWRHPNQALIPNNDEALLRQTKSIDIVFTSDTAHWSRCVVVETFISEYGQEQREAGGPITSVGGRVQFDLRHGASVSKVAGPNGLPLPDGDGMGMGWFPGYAIDVETGMRLNIFFGENSAFSSENGYLNAYPGGRPNGADMMFNPTSEVVLNAFNPFSPMRYFAGGQHFVYVTDEPYDSCAWLRDRFNPDLPNPNVRKVAAMRRIIWAGLPVLQPGTNMRSYAEGLIPNDATVKLRVERPYEVRKGSGEFNGYPAYRFKIEGKQARILDATGIKNALDTINIVPNPYYAFSEYDGSRNLKIVKITNLPTKCTVTIYSLDGKFIRQYNRDELPGTPAGSGIISPQVIPDLEWDLRNSKGIPIAPGVYLIHVRAPGLGERTLKWFGISRQTDLRGN